MADIDEVIGRTGQQQQRSTGSIRDQMKQESQARAQQTRQAQQELEEDEYEGEEDILDDGDSEVEKGKLNLKLIIVLAGACALVALLVFMVVSGSKKHKEPEIEEEPVEEIPIDFGMEVVEEPAEPVIMANYTAEQMNTLRSIGITSEELDSYMQNNVPFDYIYNTLTEQYWGWHLMNELPTYDMTSNDYKSIIDQTWMSLPERHDLAEWTTDYIAYSYDVEDNLDYEKITPYGNQLFLKIYLDDNTHDSWFFLNIRPEEWNLLGPRGNVVVNYTYQTHYKPYENIFDAEEDTENIFITAATLNIIKSDFAVTGQSSAEDGE